MNDIYAQYCQFWRLFQTCPKYRNRRACSFGQWKDKSQRARDAMIRKLESDGPPKEANPYFWIQDFEEPQPTNWNGRTLNPRVEYVIAKWNGAYGTYTKEDALAFGMPIANN